MQLIPGTLLPVCPSNSALRRPCACCTTEIALLIKGRSRGIPPVVDVLIQLPELLLCSRQFRDDLADAHRAGILREDQIPSEIQLALGNNHSSRINSMVSDIVDYSANLMGSTTGTVTIGMSECVRDAMNALRGFMFENVYGPEDIGQEGVAAREIIAALYDHFSNNPDAIPNEYNLRSESPKLAVVDYISGMTDRYAIRLSEQLYPGIAEIFLKRSG